MAAVRSLYVRCSMSSGTKAPGDRGPQEGTEALHGAELTE